MVKQCVRGRAVRQPEQACPPDDGKTRRGQNRIESLCRLLQTLARPLNPIPVAKRLRAGGKCQPRNGPRAQSGANTLSQRRRSERKAEPDSGKTEEFAEGTEHDNVAARHVGG